MVDRNATQGSAETEFEVVWLPDGQILEGSQARGFQTVELIEFDERHRLGKRGAAMLSSSPTSRRDIEEREHSARIIPFRLYGSTKISSR